MYYCTSCGLRFHQPQTCMESRGEAFGFPVCEPVNCCPRCGGSYEEHPRQRRRCP